MHLFFMELKIINENKISALKRIMTISEGIDECAVRYPKSVN